MMLRRFWFLGWILCLAFTVHAEPNFPKLSGRVVDEAGILSQSERSDLTQRLASFESQSSNQLVVVTLSTLGDLSIEEYGYQLGRAWGIGTREHDHGVLLIVAPNERKVRIEVGYGLEGALPDAIAANIIQSQILPAFKRSNMAAGVSAGVRTGAEGCSLMPSFLSFVRSVVAGGALGDRGGDLVREAADLHRVCVEPGPDLEVPGHQRPADDLQESRRRVCERSFRWLRCGLTPHGRGGGRHGAAQREPMVDSGHVDEELAGHWQDTPSRAPVEPSLGRARVDEERVGGRSQLRDRRRERDRPAQHRRR